MNILVIEDDLRISSLIERGLRGSGHRVSLSSNGKAGADMLLGGEFDAALLDILLPGMDGMHVLEQVRVRRCRTAIMVLTALDDLPTILRAFDLGADDYLVKPFHLEILLARLGAIARRQQVAQPPIVKTGGLILDGGRRTVEQNGRPIHLTRKQFDLLELLMRRQGLVTSRDDLIEAGWGCLADVKDTTLDVYIHGLRVKLESGVNPQKLMIRTVRGIGYILEAQCANP